MQLARKSTYLPESLLILRAHLDFFWGGTTAFHTALMSRLFANED